MANLNGLDASWSTALTVQTGKVAQVLFKVTLCLELAAESTLSLGLKGNRVEAFGSRTGARSRVGESYQR